MVHSLTTGLDCHVSVLSAAAVWAWLGLLHPKGYIVRGEVELLVGGKS